MPDAIIKPTRPSGCPQLGPLGLMISTRVDMKAILEATSEDLVAAKRSPLMSGLYMDREGRISVVGPMMGAPYAVALMETLIAWGARTILFFGWCGAISPDVGTGDIIVPTGALIDDGTSLHYGGDTGEIVPAGGEACRQLTTLLTTEGLPFHEAPVWSTDAPFRETPRKVDAARGQHAVAVEMETSALFTVGRYRKVAVGAVLVVSDDLSSLTWVPGFKNPRFRTARRALCQGFAKLCRTP